MKVIVVISGFTQKNYQNTGSKQLWRELRLLDDQAFAEAWTESRQRNSPRGRRMLLAELAQKGVEREVAQESVAAVDEEAAAVRAARKRSRTLRGLEFRDFRRRLGDFLARRGFGYDVCEAAIKQLWAEVGDADGQ